MRRLLALLALLGASLALLPTRALALAFPTAEGYGANSVGGRGGQVLEVTTLADCNVAGCFRWAVTQSFPRTIVFRVSGTIVTESAIKVTTPYITIAGQTSPGGVQLRWVTPPIDGRTVTGGDTGESGLQFLDGSHNIIIRHMHFRGGGYYPGDGNQNLLFYNSSGGPTNAPHDIIVDHTTDMWTADASPSPYGNNVENVTIQWTLVAEGGNLCDPPNVGQTCPAASKGPHIGGSGTSQIHVSLHHNAFISNGIRNPLVQGATNLDMVNNFGYNWGGNNAGFFGQWANNATVLGNIVNNVYVFGPSSSPPIFWLNNLKAGAACGSMGSTRVDGSAADSGGSRIYSSGNWGRSHDGGSACVAGCGDDWELYGSLDWWESGIDTSCFPIPPVTARLSTRMSAPAITTHPAAQVESVVLANVGATKPARDSIDARVIGYTTARTACNLFTSGCVSVTGGSSAADWNIYSSPMPPTDTDHDGIPDAWETAHGLNPASAADGATITASGYSNLELYLNELAGDGGAPIPPPTGGLSLTMTWDYTDVGQDGFEVLRCSVALGAANCTPTTPLALTLGPTARGATDTTLSANLRYCYGVRAIQGFLTPSALSAVDCLDVLVPGVPTQLVYRTPPGASSTNVPMNAVVVEVRDAYNSLTTSTATVTLTLAPPTQTAIPASLVTLVSVDSEETVLTSGNGFYALDPDLVSFWHTRYSNVPNDPLPHTIIVDLGQRYNVTGFRQLPRTRQDDIQPAQNGTIGLYQFFLSLDGTAWGPLVATGTWPGVALEQTVTFSGHTARYAKLIAFTEVHGSQNTAIANLTFLQTPTGSGVLTGTVVRDAVGGVASFTPAVTLAGAYVLHAASPGLTPADAPFTVTDLPLPPGVPLVRRMAH
jgi:pectate lyase